MKNEKVLGCKKVKEDENFFSGNQKILIQSK